MNSAIPSKKLTTNEHEYLTENIIKQLFRNRILTIIDFLREDADKLRIITKLNFSQIVDMKNHLFNNYSALLVNGTEFLLKNATLRKNLPTGIEKLDSILSGGLPIGFITELCGLACSGKSQICMQIAINSVKLFNKSVLYIDTKGDFSAIRIQNILQTYGLSHQDMANLMLKIKVINIWTMNDLLCFVKNLKDKSIVLENLSLIIIDSLPSLMFQHFGDDNKIGLNFLNKFVSCSRSLCKELQLAFICVNIETRWVDQERTEFDDDGTREFSNDIVYKEKRIRCLGKYWQHIPRLVIHLDKQHPLESKQNLVNVTVHKFNTTQIPTGQCLLNVNKRGVI